MKVWGGGFKTEAALTAHCKCLFSGTVRGWDTIKLPILHGRLSIFCFSPSLACFTAATFAVVKVDGVFSHCDFLPFYLKLPFVIMNQWQQDTNLPPSFRFLPANIIFFICLIFRKWHNFISLLFGSALYWIFFFQNFFKYRNLALNFWLDLYCSLFPFFDLLFPLGYIIKRQNIPFHYYADNT